MRVEAAVVHSVGKVDMKSPDFRDRVLFITMDYGGAMQGFGGWDDCYNDMLLRGVQHVTEAQTPEDMIGKPLRVLVENGLIRGVAHITNDDLVFDMPLRIALTRAQRNTR